jgi:hypothetical protein
VAALGPDHALSVREGDEPAHFFLLGFSGPPEELDLPE